MVTGDILAPRSISRCLPDGRSEARQQRWMGNPAGTAATMRQSAQPGPLEGRR